MNDFINFLEVPIIVFSKNLQILSYNKAFQKILPLNYNVNQFLNDNDKIVYYLKKTHKEKVVKTSISVHFKANLKEAIFQQYELQMIYHKKNIYCIFYHFKNSYSANFSILTEYLPLGVVVHQNNKIVYINNYALKILKANKEEEILNKSILEFVDKNYQDIVHKRIENIYKKDEEAKPLEEILLTMDKTPFYAEVRAKKILWNEQPAVLVLFQNISNLIQKRKFSEKLMVLLQKIIQENHLPSIIENILHTFKIILNSNLVCIWSEETIKESNIDQLIENHKFSIISPDKEDIHSNFFEKLILDKESPLRKCLLSKKPIFYRNVIQEIENPSLRKLFMEHSIISYWSIPFINKMNECYGAFISFNLIQNIAEIEFEYLYQASFLCSILIERNKIENENLLLSQISRKANDLILLINENNHIIWHNDKLIDFFPQLKSTVNIIDFINSLSIKNYNKEWIIKKILLKEIFKIELEIKLINEIKYFNFIFENLQNEKNQTFYYLIFQDITKEIEYEKQLIEAKNLAEKNAQIKSEFLSIMSHEIRTPLNVIIGIAQLLMRNNPREDQLDDLKLLKSSSEHLLSLVNNILDYNKIEVGKFSLQKEIFSLHEMLTQTIEMFKNTIKEKNLIFEYNFHQNLPEFILGDKTRLNQILMNVLTNAVKFTEEGKITFNIIPLNKTENQIWIKFEIIDTGIGIPNEELNQIFEPFKQLDYKPSRKYGGTGLGLAITKKLVELFNGKIFIQSEPNKGTYFAIEIPLEIYHKKEISNREMEQNQEIPYIKILIVEDYYPNLLITQKFLEMWKIVCDFATNGEEAIIKARKNQYDLILMDLHMPIMDGYTATKKIREFNKDIPIIAITASAMEDLTNKLKESELTDILIKPFKPDDLYKKISKYVSKKFPQIGSMDFHI